LVLIKLILDSFFLLQKNEFTVTTNQKKGRIALKQAALEKLQ
jgi:hypothetical protein